jgi:hypothetical protein
MFLVVANFYQFKGQQHQKKIFLKDFLGVKFKIYIVKCLQYSITNYHSIEGFKQVSNYTTCKL